MGWKRKGADMRKSLKNVLKGCLVAAAAFLILPGAKAQASVVQTGATTNSATIRWDAPSSTYSEVTQYQVYVGTDYQNTALYRTFPANTTSCTITGLSAGVKKYVKIEYTYRSKGSTSTKTYTSSAGSTYDVKTLPGKVTGVKQDRWYYFALSFYATWNKIEAADGYEYVVRTNTGKVFKKGETGYNWNQFSVNKISNEIIYTVQVRAYTKINGVKCYGEWSDPGYFFTQPRITSIRVANKKMTIKWNKVAGATGYNIYVSTKPRSGYKKVKSVGKSKSSVTITKFKGKKISAKKTYYVYVATKKKVGKTTYTSGKLYYWNCKGTKFNSSNFGYF